MNVSLEITKNSAKQAIATVNKQATFALSQALNTVGNEGQAEVQKKAGGVFQLRRPDFIKRTIKRNREDFATKANPVAIVRIDPSRNLLVKFEEGDPKTPRDGHNIAIPTTNVRRTKVDIVAKAQRPRQLLASAKATNGRVWKTAKAILQRVGRGKAATVEALYILKPRVRIPRRLAFVATISDVVRRRWVDVAGAAFDKAIGNAR